MKQDHIHEAREKNIVMAPCAVHNAPVGNPKAKARPTKASQMLIITIIFIYIFETHMLGKKTTVSATAIDAMQDMLPEMTCTARMISTRLVNSWSEAGNTTNP